MLPYLKFNTLWPSPMPSSDNFRVLMLSLDKLISPQREAQTPSSFAPHQTEPEQHRDPIHLSPDNLLQSLSFNPGQSHFPINPRETPLASLCLTPSQDNHMSHITERQIFYCLLLPRLPLIPALCLCHLIAQLSPSQAVPAHPCPQEGLGRAGSHGPRTRPHCASARLSAPRWGPCPD